MSTRTSGPEGVAGRRKGSASRLTNADLVVLGLLSERPMHGYELMQEYHRQEVQDWATVSRGHVYYALKKLAGLGLVLSAEKEGRDKTVYRVSQKGTNALADALCQNSWANTRIPDPFSTWLALSIHARPNELRAVLDARQSFLSSELEREKNTLSDIRADEGPRTGVAEAMVTLAIRQFEVELAWLNQNKDLLAGG